MTNLDRVVAVLERHREARQWTDEAAARDVLVELGLDPSADVVTEAEATAAEAHAAEVAEVARTTREAYQAQANAQQANAAAPLATDKKPD